MEPRCILCDRLLMMSDNSPADQQDTDMVCVSCKALPSEDREALRERATARLLRTHERTR